MAAQLPGYEADEIEIVPSTGLPRPIGLLKAEDSHLKNVKFTKTEQSLVMANIVTLMARRKTNREIAEELGLSPSTVHQYQKKVREGWLERMHGTYDELRARELHEIDEVQRKAEEAYEASKGRKKRTATRSSFVGGDKDGQNRTLKAQEQNVVQLEKPEGDPRFLDIIMKCIDRRIKLMGLDEPTKFQINGGVGEGKGRTKVDDRFTLALALVGITPGDPGAAAPGGDPDGDGAGESLDPDYAYVEASGVLKS